MSNLLQNISWSQYLVFIAVLATFYYAGVILLYFRKNISDKFGSKGQRPAATEKEPAHVDDAPAGELMDDLEATVNDIGHSILVPGNKATPGELLEQLKVRVARFGGLSRPGYRYALNNYIIEKAREHCAAEFSEEELEEAWDSLR